MMDDQREPPINPYQSPRSDFPAEEEAASPERVYGLREPIRMQGKLSADDVREKDNTTISRLTIAALLILIVLAGVVYIGTLALIVLVIFPAAWVLVLMGSRRYPRRVERNAVFATTTFTEDEIVTETENGKGVLRWWAFCQCRCSDQKVLLFMDPSGSHTICPKRFFASEHDWRTFLGLVRWKLPEDDQSARKLAAARTERLAGQAPGAETAFAAAKREGRQPLARVSGSISWEDWKHVHKLIGRPWLSRTLRAGCLLPFVIAGAVLIWSMDDPERMWIPLVSLGVPALVLLCLLFVFPAESVRRQCKRREGPFAPFEVRVWDEGMEFVGRTSAAMIPWKGFAKLTQTDRVLLLHETAPPAIRFIPRALLSSEEEWDALLRLVREKVPEE